MSRGYGRVRLSDFHVGVFSLQKEELGVDTAQFEQLFEGCNIL